MGGVQDIIERIKYADEKLKKQIVLGSVAGVLLLAAAIFLIRGLAGPAPAEAPSQAQQAADELRKELKSEATTEDIDEDMQPFTGAAQSAG